MLYFNSSHLGGVADLVRLEDREGVYPCANGQQSLWQADSVPMTWRTLRYRCEKKKSLEGEYVCYAFLRSTPRFSSIMMVRSKWTA